MYVDSILTIEDVPVEAINDLTVPGVDAAPAAQHWREVLSFSVNRENAVECLTKFGAWNRAELKNKSDNELSEIVLWLACGSFKDRLNDIENGNYHTNEFGEVETPGGSDIFPLE